MLGDYLAGAFAVGVEFRGGKLLFESGDAALCRVDLALHRDEPRRDNALPLVEARPDPATGGAAVTAAAFFYVQAAVGAVIVVATEVVGETAFFKLDYAG